jgi:hypothetical protein
MDIPKALNEIRPDEKFAMDDYTDYETLVWYSNTPKPTKEEVADGWNLYVNSQYQRDRKKEYDKLNQFELIGEDSINGTTNHRDAIIAIKDKYPKE